MSEPSKHRPAEAVTEELLARRAQHLAERHRTAAADPRLPDHLVVGCVDLKLAIPTAQLQGLARRPVTPVPMAPPELVGVTAYQGELWPVWQLKPGPGPWLVFWKRKPLCLQVDSLLGLEWVEPERLLPPPDLGWPGPFHCRAVTPHNWLVVEVP